MAAGSTVMLPWYARDAVAADVDVVIIGAGAAGLAAAGTLMGRGAKVKVVEAANRIGGRAHTESETFGVPFDRGCTFQHVSHRNPFVKYAKKNGFDIGQMPDPDETSKVFVGEFEATQKQYKAMVGRESALRRAIARAGKSGRDISMRKAISRVKKNEFTPLAEFWLRAGSGQELEDVSVKDWWAGSDGKDFYCPAGYGTLVAHYGRKVPVELETTVSEIDWSGKGVKVTTSKGTITARYCIVTVSLGVLQAGNIKFTPQLPKWKIQALDGFNMGNFLNIGMQFKWPRVFTVEDNARMWVNGEHDEMLAFLSNMGGHGVSRATASGNLARDLEMAGEKEAIDFAMGRLVVAFGSLMPHKLKKATTTDWIGNPLTLGTWAFAKPGHASRRAALRKRVGRQVYFAGEACHKNMFATCHGALLSGQAVGRQVAKRV